MLSVCHKVLVRFNLLVIILCLVMNRPYQFYYFVPLVSFWFVFIYVTMSVWPRITTTSVDSKSHHVTCGRSNINAVICLQCFDTVGWASGRASGL